ncbi:gliding motility lipoprotein GldD [Emticicia sp. TH156]|uniref:gliding motility lipoprotein GldD n=1 Tax=Emticicia sp. TH156 TaxID=2067454 RepID=UPI000C768DC2|nr:gliding motility lipoprotein GldD [Emticicia sp. TH156]PLK45659.1 gliding motility lipoprotein GldD [Emticicia sp. TH156]
MTLRSTLLRFTVLVFLAGVVVACQKNKSDFLPKPTGFNRLDLPPHQYQSLTEDHPYTFEYSKAAIVQKDTHSRAEPHWIILYYPKLDTRIQFTYKPVKNDPRRLQNMMADAARLAFHHDKKAYSIADKVMTTKAGKKVIIFELEGEVPSHYQFFVTDTTNHYLRGVVYLKTATRNDSLRPVIDYMKADCNHLLETLKWKNN